jgi:hypothetical protein
MTKIGHLLNPHEEKLFRNSSAESRLFWSGFKNLLMTSFVSTDTRSVVPFLGDGNTRPPSYDRIRA